LFSLAALRPTHADSGATATSARVHRYYQPGTRVILGHQTTEDAHRIVAEHLHDALVTTPPGATDVGLANYLLGRWAGLDLTDDARHEAVLMIADEVRNQRDTTS
jgi:hypothetical protein